MKARWKRPICRAIGHTVNPDPNHPWCGRCGLAYEEIYHRNGEPLRYATAMQRTWNPDILDNEKWWKMKTGPTFHEYLKWLYQTTVEAKGSKFSKMIQTAMPDLWAFGLSEPTNIDMPPTRIRLTPAEAAAQIRYNEQQPAPVDLPAGTVAINHDLLQEMIDLIAADVPSRNCSCHIHPPCSDCVVFSRTREMLEQAREALAGKLGGGSEPIVTSKRNHISVEYGPGKGTKVETIAELIEWPLLKSRLINGKVPSELLVYLTDPREEVSEATIALIKAMGYECKVWEAPKHQENQNKEP